MQHDDGSHVLTSSDARTTRDLFESIKRGWHEGKDPPDALLAVRRYPEFRENHSVYVDLAYEEYCLLKEQGKTPELGRFVARFPLIADSLKRCICIDGLISEIGVDGPADEVEWPEEGTRINDDYVLDEVIGQGAFSRVYLGRDEKVGGRRVAIKVCWRGKDEATTLGKLENDHIVPIHTTDKHGSLGLLIMPYHGRATLADVLQGLRDGWDSALPHVRSLWETLHGDRAERSFRIGSLEHRETMLGWARGIATGLAHCHSRGIYHLDLKPANILITDHGQPRLLDFNLSRDLNESDSSPGGTIPYMAPEQLEYLRYGSSIHRLTGQTDLFSFGVILYQMYTCDLPFEPASSQKNLALQMQDAQQRGRRPWPTPEVAPHQVMQLVDECLALEPESRPADVNQILQPLNRELTWGKRQMRWFASNVQITVALLALLLSLTGAGIWWFAKLPPKSERFHSHARSLLSSSHDREALRYLNLSIEADPTNVEALVTRAKLFIACEDFPSAMRDLRNVIERDDMFEHCSMIGYCYQRMDLNSVAVGWYRRALAKGEESEAVLWNLIRAYISMKRLAPALEVTEDLLKANPDSFLGLFAKSYILFARGSSDVNMYERVIAVCDIAIGADTENERFHLLRANASAELAAIDPTHRVAALTHVRRAIENGVSIDLLKQNTQIKLILEVDKSLVSKEYPSHPFKLIPSSINPTVAGNGS